MPFFVPSEWITANAGSGKTTALTARVVRLLLLGVEPERIVCITYTKAAAAEMRHRVLGRLRKLLLASEEECRAEIEKLTGEVADARMLAHARNLFGRVLDSTAGGLQLTTIHGFCQNILRRFPIEAGIAPHFTVLEDVAADALLRQSKYALLTGLRSADAWLTDAIALIGARGGEYRFETLAGDIISKRRQWDEIWRAQSPESLRGHIYGLHGIEVEPSADVLEVWFAEAVQVHAVAVRESLPALLGHATKSYRVFGEGLAAWFEADIDRRRVELADFISLFIKEDGERRKRLLNEKEYPVGHRLREAVETIAELAERYHMRASALACAEESFAVAVLARALLDQYALAKAAMHALDYDDLILHTLRLVQQPETLGWVMSKLDHRIDHLLIDEAQDNSSAQWQLAHTLVEELIANNGGVGSADLPRSLLVVGDEKQSIYSFQGAAPEEFNSYQRSFKTLLDGSAAPLQQGALSNSYRSAEAVLTLVDDVCQQPEIARALGAAGEIQRHRLIREGAAGLVQLYPPIITPEKEGLPPLVIPTEYTIATSAPQLLADEIADRIHGWLMVEKRQLTSEGRAIKAGDILILVHRRKPLVQPLIRALQRRGIPVAGIDRLTLSKHLAVSDLLALMAWCDNIADDLALAQVLRSPLVGISDDALRGYAFGRAGMLWNEINMPWLAEVRTWRGLSPYDFLTQVLEVSGKRRDFARRFGEEVHEVLDELKAQAAAMPVDMPATIAHFYAMVTGSARQIKREQESAAIDQVRIMTVHGAKGLEAPVVILADTVSVPTTQHERMFVIPSPQDQLLPVLGISSLGKAALMLVAAKQHKAHKLQDEYARLLYVALTRARDELHVFGTASKKGAVKAGSWYEVVVAAMRGLNAHEQDEHLVLRDVRMPVVTKASDASARTVKPIPAWAAIPPVGQTAVAASLAPSSLGVAAPSPYALRAAEGAKERGVRLHRVLELLQADSTLSTIEKLVRYVAPDWNVKEQAQAVAEVNALLLQERWLWQHPRAAEVNIAGTITQNGESVATSGQIDVLIDTPEAIIILDYKTGVHVPSAVEEVSLNYLLQLKIYRELVRQLYPDRSVRCAILWTAAPLLRWLDDAVENTAFPDKNVMLKTIEAA